MIGNRKSLCWEKNVKVNLTEKKQFFRKKGKFLVHCGGSKETVILIKETGNDYFLWLKWAYIGALLLRDIIGCWNY